ncbi:hypothetical protein [Streptomyces sp.]|uniref:hypothetical protein n=1 Tax=Streptomyces sp. TaxID=1931 RepID=UPI002D786F0E|nr:hypothetical protein [Streptomyces sp.]HET6354875.1 hypothetical protein [Streptomyces sp.]
MLDRPARPQNVQHNRPSFSHADQTKSPRETALRRLARNSAHGFVRGVAGAAGSAVFTVLLWWWQNR